MSSQGSFRPKKPFEKNKFILYYSDIWNILVAKECTVTMLSIYKLKKSNDFVY